MACSTGWSSTTSFIIASLNVMQLMPNTSMMPPTDGVRDCQSHITNLGVRHEADHAVFPPDCQHVHNGTDSQARIQVRKYFCATPQVFPLEVRFQRRSRENQQANVGTSLVIARGGRTHLFAGGQMNESLAFKFGWHVVGKLALLEP